MLSCMECCRIIPYLLCFKSAANVLGLRKLDSNNLIKNGALGSTLAGFYLGHCANFGMVGALLSRGAIEYFCVRIWAISVKLKSLL